jgi:Outer membrane lipoprotein-sorting protein
MIFRSAQFRKPLALLIAFSVATICRAEPDAEAILRAARLNPLGHNISLKAQLRTDSGTTPFEIVVDDAVHYLFENPAQELILELRDDSSSLSERTGGKAAPVRLARFDDSVRGAGITYEDLSLKFLYWKNPKLLGEETIRSRKAWKMELQAALASSQYGAARIWIDQESGALLRIEGYNRDGKLLRRFEVISAQKIEGQWMLKQMRVETLDPETRKILNRTYLEVLGKTGTEPGNLSQ